MKKLRAKLFEHRIDILLVLLAILPALSVNWLSNSMLLGQIKSERIKMVGSVADAKHAQLAMVLRRANNRATLLLSHLSELCAASATGLNLACASQLISSYLTAENALGASLFQNGHLVVAMDGFAVRNAADLKFRPGQLAAFYGTGPAANIAYFIAANEPAADLKLAVAYPSSSLQSVFDRPADLGDSGETFLVDGAGYFVTQARYPSLQGHEHSIGANPMRACLGGGSADVLDLDYRDAQVIHGYRFVPELGGGCIMAHIDQAEAFAPLAALHREQTAVLLIFLLPVMLAAMYLARRNLGAEASLRASENKFCLLFETASDCLLILDMDGRILDINRSGHERLGYSKEEMLGKRISQFDPPEFADKVPARMAELRDRGVAMFESAHVRKDGSVMPVEINTRVVELDGQKQVFSVIRDISERARMEGDLRKSEAQYRAVIETSADGFWITDLQGRLIEVNDAYVRRSGYSREELLNMSIPDVEAAEKPEDTTARIQKILIEGYDRFESRHRAKNGSVWPVEVMTSYWPIGGGRLFVFLADITGRKAIEQAILDSERRYRSLFDNLLDGFALFKAVEKVGRVEDFSCVEVNDAFVNLTGLTGVIGKSGREIVPGIRENNPEMFEAFSRVALGGQPERFETHLHGLRKWFAISLYSPASGYVGLMFDDISERKRSEKMISTRLDYLTRQANDIILLWGADGRILDANERAVETYGYGAEELLRMNIADVRLAQNPLPPESTQRRILEAGSLRFDSVHVRKDGSHFPVEVSVRTIKMDEEMFMQGIVRDISERKSAERLLLEKERRLAEAQHLAKLGSWEWDAASGAVYWSEELYRIFGYDPAQTLPAFEEHLALYAPASRTVFEVAVEQARYSGQITECDLELAGGNGTPHWVFARFEPMRAADGAVTGVRGTIQDISERKRQEDLVQAANREIHDLYNNAPCGYHSLDRDGVIVAINSTELSWLGYRRKEVVGKLRFSDIVSPECAAVFNKTFPRLKEQGSSRDVELELLRKDGSRLPVLISATAIKDREGNFLMSRSTVYDMTEKRIIEQERARNAKRLLKLSQRMVTVQEMERRWIASELHDRSSANLAALLLNCKLIGDKLLPLQQQDVREVLEDTRALLEDTSVNIRDVCANLRPTVLDLAGFWPALEGYAQQFSRRTGIAVSLEQNGNEQFPPDVKSTLFRIVQEALTNSTKHSEATEIRIGLGKSSGNRTVLTISDNGRGFDPAGDAHAPGLGLITMQERAEFIGGKFDYETAPGQGMHIRVELADNFNGNDPPPDFSKSAKLGANS